MSMENNTIKILANAVTCKVDTEDRNVKLEVNRCLTYFVDGYEQSTAFKMHTWDGTASFFNFAKCTFPAGFMYYVGACLKRKGYDVQFYKKPLPKPLGKLRPKIGNYEYDPRYEYQYTVTEKLLKHGQIIFRGATGCHAKGTKVLMFDGSFKNVEDVIVGDKLMGVDSSPRTVLSLTRGRDKMYKITPHRYGNPFIVNSKHILSLEMTNVGVGHSRYKYSGTWTEVSVEDYLTKWNKNQRHIYKLHRSRGIDFSSQESLPLDPYLLGVLLGDGTFCGGTNGIVSICTMDIEVAKYVNDWAENHNMDLTVGDKKGSLAVNLNIVGYKKGESPKPNYLKAKLRDLNLLKKNSEEKFVPKMYLTASKEDRLQLLAGILDTDGHLSKNCFNLTMKSKQVIDAVAFIARSLGLAVHQSTKTLKTGDYAGRTYHRVSISGDTDKIPTKVAHKQATPRGQKKDNCRSGFTVDYVGVDDYYGFTLDRDHLYMLDDFTVTHNCGKSLVAQIAFATINRPTLFLTTRSILMYQMKENVENNLGIDVAVIGDGNLGFENSDGSKSLKKFTVATVQTIHSYIKEPNPTDSAHEFTAQKKRQEFMKSILEKFEFVILEEAHESSASGWFELLKYCKNAYYRLALTGTPFMKESEEMNMRLMASSGPVAITVTEKQLIDCGILATPYFKFVHLTKKPATMSMKTSWQPAYRIGIVENEERNQAIIYEAKRAVAHGLTVMILFKQIAHGKTLKEMLDAVSIPNELIVGADDQTERKRAINKLKDGKIKVLLGSTILDVGVDVPAVGMVIIASAGKAEVALRQRIGRGLRAKKNQANICFVVDFDDPFNKYLKNHAQQRKAIIQHTDGFKEHIVEDFDYSLLKV